MQPVCQNERDAAAQALAEVQGLRGQRPLSRHNCITRRLSRKPGIIAAIKRINEVELPPAEAALAQAEAALATCLSAHDIGGPLDDPVLDPMG